MPKIDIPGRKFTLGNYDKEFEKELYFFIKNLNDYKHPVDNEGKAIPVNIPEANNLRDKLNDLIDIEKYIYPDQETYEAYAYRTRDIVVRQAITTYIANGCKWEDCDDYWQWVYSEQIDAKLTMFGEQAAAAFKAEIPRTTGRKMALKFMTREFTYDDLVRFSQENSNICKNPYEMINSYKKRGLVTQGQDGKYTIREDICEKYGIT